MTDEFANLPITEAQMTACTQQAYRETKGMHPDNFAIRIQELAEAIVFGKANRVIPEHDIFACRGDLALTDTMQIVAPGPNGKDAGLRIESELFTIALNKAISIGGIYPNLWMVADRDAPKCDWFRDGMVWRNNIACFDSFLHEVYPQARYSFQGGQRFGFIKPIMEGQPEDAPYPMMIELYDGFLRGNGSVATQALQWVYFMLEWLSSLQRERGEVVTQKEIRLIGCDMIGDKYFDGSDRNNHPNDLDAARAWVNQIIYYIQAKGIKVVSLSETSLDVEVV